VRNEARGVIWGVRIAAPELASAPLRIGDPR